MTNFFSVSSIIISFINNIYKKYIPQCITIIITKYYGFLFIKYHKNNITSFYQYLPTNFYINGSTILFTTIHNTIYGKGNNDMGQMGIKSTNIMSYKDLQLISFFNNKQITVN